MNLTDLLSRITAVLDDETDPEVVEPPEPVDINRALTMAATGHYADLSDAEKLAYWDVVERLDAAYLPDDSVSPTEDTEPMPDAMRGWGTLGFRWL